MTSKREFAIVLDVEANYGSPQFVARFCYLNEDGELRNPLGDRWEEGAEFADFTVSAYVGGANEGAWGFQHGYLQPYRVELHRAEAMVKLLRKVEKGLERMNGERGYLRQDDFHQYVLRIAEVLRIKRFYVRNTTRAQAVSGQQFRATDGSGVQSWIFDRAQATTSV
jgi:hypothetical protein